MLKVLVVLMYFIWYKVQPIFNFESNPFRKFAKKGIFVLTCSYDHFVIYDSRTVHV